MTEDIRSVVSTICCGIDDMHLLGNKALVLRAEIFPSDLEQLPQSLRAIEVQLTEQSLPDKAMLIAEVEYPLTIQITSFSDDT